MTELGGPAHPPRRKMSARSRISRWALHCKRRPNDEVQIPLIFKAMSVDGMLQRIQRTPEHLPSCNASVGK
jgi:hypothetical protein